MLTHVGFLILLVVALLASAGIAHATDLWIKDLCLAQNFAGAGSVVSDFRAASGGCSFQFEDALRGTVSQWFLGFKFDLALVSTLAKTFGVKPKNSEDLEIRSGITTSSAATHRSFFAKASRKRILFGFSVEW